MSATAFKVGDIVVPDYEGTGLVAKMAGSRGYVMEALAKTDDGLMIITETSVGVYKAYRCEYYRVRDTWSDVLTQGVWDWMYFEANELKKVG